MPGHACFILTRVCVRCAKGGATRLASPSAQNPPIVLQTKRARPVLGANLAPPLARQVCAPSRADGSLP